MRVTKLIREYVEKSVAKAMPNKTIENCSIREEYLAIEDEIKEIAEAKIDAFMAKHKGEVRAYYGGYHYEDFEENVKYIKKELRLCLPCLRYKAEAKVEEENKKLAEARKKAVDDILINLELGGTKADLDKMIAELGKGE